MRFLLRPLCKHVTSNCCFVLTKGQGLSIEHYVDRLSDTQAEIFQGDRHEAELPRVRAFGFQSRGFERIQIRAQLRTRDARYRLEEQDALCRHPGTAPLINRLPRDIQTFSQGTQTSDRFNDAIDRI